MNFFENVRMVLTHPQQFFRDMESYTLWEVTRFAIYNWILTVVTIAVFWRVGIPAGNMRGLLDDTIFIPLLPMRLLFLSSTLIGVLWLGAALLHGAAKLLGGAGDFMETFAIVGFSSATVIFHVIPWIGGLLAYYELVILAVGIRERHQLSWPKTLLTLSVLLLLAIATALWHRAR